MEVTASLEPIAREIFAWEPGDERPSALLGVRCARCGCVSFPPAVVCADCGSAELTPHPLSREGSVFETTRVVRGAPGFEAPYYVGYVDVPEGVRVFTQFAGEGAATLAAGDAVRWTPWPVRARTGEERIGYAFTRVAP